MKLTYLSILQQERKERVKKGLYDYITVKMAYDTSKIEGSTLTLSDTQSLYERNVVPTGGHKLDDIIESRNHFDLVDFMFETINEPFSERLIKEYHQMLKKGTSDEKRYSIGGYKSIPNIAGTQKVAQPYEVPELMFNLLNKYNTIEDIELEDILTFHHQFELIHPFQDGNGRVGRIIILRECFRNGVTPFIISSDRREEYINGLKMYKSNPSFLIEEATLQQQDFKDIAEPFVTHYQKVAESKRKDNHEG